MIDIDAILRLIDHFLPLDVISSVFLVFALENVMELTLGEIGLVGWITVYVVGIVVVSALNLVSADEEEIEDIREDIDDVRNG